MNRKPNILFIFSDQHRASAVGCYGNSTVQTPHLDRFTREALVAETCISNTPVCGPYRASLMTGRYAHNCGYPSNNLPFNPTGACLADAFSDAGYATGYIGKWHLYFPEGHTPSNDGDGSAKGFVPVEHRYGFKDFWAGFNGGHEYHRWHYFRDDDPEPIKMCRYQPEAQVDLTLEFIQRSKTSMRPWLLCLSWGPPHTPFDPPDGYATPYLKAPLPDRVPSGRPASYARRALPGYFGLITSVDEAFGRLIRGLDAAGVSQNTIVIYTSDHGEMLGSHGYKGNKRWPYDDSLRVPWLIRWPGRIRGGTRLTRPLGTPDIFPTLADLAGLDAPPNVDGTSAARAFLTGDESNRDEFAYCTMPYAYVPWPGWRAVRSDRYLYARTRSAPWLLFDYRADPAEQRNRVNDPACTALVRDLDALLHEKMKACGDHWEYRVEGGDVDLWTRPDTPKMRSNDLGVPWPLA